MKKEKGSEGFSELYWRENYEEAQEMDGIGNVEQHVGYLKNLFGLEYIDISSVIDFGFGLGHLFEGVLKEFIPYRAAGLEPSAYAFEKVKARQISPVESTKLTLKKKDLLSWALEQTPKSRWYDLGICTSVFQYMTKEEIETVLPVMAQKVKYLYFSVPTNKELDRQVEELEFHDRFAYKRSRSTYQRLIKKHFTFVSARLLESKVHFDEDSSAFTDLLFRF